VLTPEDESRALEQLVERLTARFSEIPGDTVRAIVTATHEQFTGRPIRDFVPVLVEREAKERLTSDTQH
jgi:hypothetical protein